MSPPRILVADDDAWILRMVTTVLEKRGYVVETAVDGEDALAKAIRQTPALIITDVMMPRMDGWALVKALRSRGDFAFVPVIFLTALGADDDRIRGFRLGADDYLPKPFRFEELDLRVANTLRRRALIERAARAELAQMSMHPTENPPAPIAGLSGLLDQVGLPTLLTLLEMERKSGILVLTDGETGAVGRIFVQAGRVVHARLDDHDEPLNHECVYYMLSWADGSFEFNALEVDMDDDVQTSTTHLLMEGARRLDEDAEAAG